MWLDLIFAAAAAAAVAAAASGAAWGTLPCNIRQPAYTLYYECYVLSMTPTRYVTQSPRYTC